MPEAFGRYRVERPLGAGGMGAVYLARDEALGRQVAVKTLHPWAHLAALPDELRERLDREARALAALSHPNIVRVFDVGVERGHTYLVMELVSGRTLKDRLESDGALPVPEARALGIQLAGALHAAHDAGMIHRDVKPANVLEAGPGTWKLADFGIAHTPDSSLTISGQFLGTPAYAAPESLDGLAAGPAADVYSLASMLYEAIGGEPPFGRGGLMTVMVAAATRAPAPLAARCPAVPAHIDEVLRRSLSVQPEARPSAAELAEILATDVPVATAAPAAAPPTAAPIAPVAPPASVAGRRALVIGGALGLAILFGVLVGRADRDASPAPGPPPAHRGMGATADPWSPPGLRAPAPVPRYEELLPIEALPDLAWQRPRRGRGHDKHAAREVRRWRKVRAGIEEGKLREAERELAALVADDPGDGDAAVWLERVREARALGFDRGR